MEIKVSKATLKLPSIYLWEFPEVKLESKTSDIVIIEWNDDFGPSSALTITRQGVAASRSIIAGKEWSGCQSRLCWKGVCYYHIEPGDQLQIQTVCSHISATVEAVIEASDGGKEIHLRDAAYCGAWGNFTGTQCTFGSIEWETSESEEVVATGFYGTLGQYRRLREEEPRYDSREECIERRGLMCLLPNPAHERAEQLAEALGY